MFILSYVSPVGAACCDGVDVRLYIGFKLSGVVEYRTINCLYLFSGNFVEYRKI